MQKLKQKLLKFAALGTSLGVLLLTVTQPVMAGSFQEDWQWLTDGLHRIAGFFVNPIATSLEMLRNAFLLLLTSFAYGVVVVINSFLEVAINSQDALKELGVIELIWKSMLTIANSLFLLALIIASVAIILRINVNTYNIKKALGGLVMAIALSNLSLLIVGALTEFANELNTVIVNLLTVGLPDNSPLKNEKGVAALLHVISGIIDIKSIPNREIEGMVVGLIMIILIGWVMWKLALILIERIIWLFALTIVAPLAFALSLLPTMQDYTKEWWSHLMKWLLVLPATTALIVIAIIVMNGGTQNLTKENFSAKLDSFKNITEWGTNKETGEAEKVLTSDLIQFIAGLAILWMAGEAGKKLKVGGPLSSGTAYKMAADTVTGKSATGKFIGGRGRDVYNLSQGTEKGRQFEAWRKSQTGNLGRIVNPVGRRKKIEADRAIEQNKALVGVYAGKSAAKQKEIGILDRQIQVAPANSALKANLEKKKRALERQYSDITGSLDYHLDQANKDTTTDKIDSFDKLQASIDKLVQRKNNPKPGDKKFTTQDAGDLAQKIHLMRKLSRAKNIRPEEAADAKEWFGSSDGESAVKAAALNTNKYSTTPTVKVQAQKAKAQAIPIADVELLQANEEMASIKPNLETAINSAGLDSNLANQGDVGTKEIAVALKIDTAFNAAGLIGSISDDHFKNIIAAQTAGATGTPAELEAWLKANWVTLTGTTGLLPSAADITEYDDINTALKSAGASGDVGAIKNYQNLHRATAPGEIAAGQSIQTVLQNIQQLQTDFIAQQEIAQQAQSAINQDNQTTPEGYNLIIQNRINYLTSPAGGRYTTIDARDNVNNTITTAQNITNNALEEPTYNPNDLVANLPQAGILQQQLQDLGIPVVANQTVGDTHILLRRLKHNVDKS